jgi:hypothetical protein
MSNAPFQMLGLTANRDERRLMSVSVPWNCTTLAETMSVGGGKPFGLPETGRQVSQLEDGSFQVFGKDYFAYAGKLDGGKFNVSWNEAPENTHAGAVLGEDFVQSGDCLTGAKGKVCLWDLGKRPTK